MEPTLRPICAIVGRDRFLRSEALERFLRGGKEDADALGTARYEGDSADLAEVLDEARTPSLLEDYRVVVVDQADGFISANRAALERYAAAPSDTGSLILMCQSMPKSTRLYKIIAESGTIVHCDVPSGAAICGWITHRANDRYGKRIDRVAAQRLREMIGDAPGWLDAEIAKLATYVGERPEVTPKDIELLTGCRREEKIFAVTDAISNGDTATAISSWEQVLATDRAAPGRAIAGLAWGVRRLLAARADYESGVSIRELARKLYTDPTVLKTRLQRTSIGGLMQQQRDLLAADLAVKTGGSTVDVAVERFIVKHSAYAQDSGATSN